MEILIHFLNDMLVFKENSPIQEVTLSITDHLMSGLAIFGLKCPSLLDYDRKRSDDIIAQNLRDLYHVKNPPSDTYLRERLDLVDPERIRPAFKKVFAFFQRGKGLEEFNFLDGYVLISGDGGMDLCPNRWGRLNLL